MSSTGAKGSRWSTRCTRHPCVTRPVLLGEARVAPPRIEAEPRFVEALTVRAKASTAGLAPKCRRAAPRPANGGTQLRRPPHK
jgi:hypothetical protein